jgi:alanyl-tRNA synthetase
METLDAGLRVLQEESAALKEAGKSVLPGSLIFKLYDTFGFPTDLTADIVKKDGMTLDMDGFEAQMELQRERARGAWKGSGEEAVAECYLKVSSSGVLSEFCGYEGVTGTRQKSPQSLWTGSLWISHAQDSRPKSFWMRRLFTANLGGQAGDTGYLEGADFNFIVEDTKKPVENFIVHKGVVKSGEIKIGASANLVVDLERRKAIAANHSGTHILQAALKAVLGDHIKQSDHWSTPSVCVLTSPTFPKSATKSFNVWKPLPTT